MPSIKHGMDANSNIQIGPSLTAIPNANWVNPGYQPDQTVSPQIPLTASWNLPVQAGTEKTIQLREMAGSIKINITVDPFRISDADKAFITAMVKLVRDYEAEQNG